MKRFALIFVALIIALLIWSGTWFFTASKIKAQVKSLANPTDESQPSISCADFTITGFPFKLAATCQNATIIDGDKTFTLKKLKAKISLASPSKVKISAQGPLNYSNAFFASEHELRWEEFNANASTKFFQFEALEIKANNIQYFDLLMGENLLASSDIFEISLINNPNKYDKLRSLATLDLKASGHNLDIALANVTKGRVSLYAEIEAVPDDVRNFFNPDILSQWQKMQGLIKLHHFKAEEEKASFDISGKMRLEETGHISGKFKILSNGIVEQFSQNIPKNMQPIIFGSQKPDGSYQQNIRIIKGNLFTGIIPITNIAPLF